ncbi:uncharacterized protein EV422DRAFT_519210 [Fimicolochytrium jonesii]|uniref:uncharacterized protein n=1 Tax=Fimicolochytrium jonesii TaxID=1396493 RepID=UPI0022FF3800|nr:uncharacterized protein EV422DRAFT_519210 [Fimicolochytrium jonesii]KAI8824183.1 hypothetical protein EV422DRAFT_519210 [Fimicolochytrium jonesii]
MDFNTNTSYGVNTSTQGPPYQPVPAPAQPIHDQHNDDKSKPWSQDAYANAALPPYGQPPYPQQQQQQTYAYPPAPGGPQVVYLPAPYAGGGLARGPPSTVIFVVLGVIGAWFFGPFAFLLYCCIREVRSRQAMLKGLTAGLLLQGLIALLGAFTWYNSCVAARTDPINNDRFNNDPTFGGDGFGFYSRSGINCESFRLALFIYSGISLAVSALCALIIVRGRKAAAAAATTTPVMA